MTTKVTGDEILNLPGNRQDDTTNTTPNNVRICYGWGVITPGAVNNATETVTFPFTFAQRPIVTAVYGGDNASATSYGSGTLAIKVAATAAHTITTTNFVVSCRTVDATTWSAGNTVFYQWTATGEV